MIAPDAARRAGIDAVVGDDGTLRATVAAPAKLNLCLAVGARRADGFHELVSVIQGLDLADRVDIDIDPRAGDRDVLVEAPGLAGGDTLVTRAVGELLERCGSHARCWVTIDKEIPAGAGLGGGSSDAAAALRAVHALLGAPLAPAELHEIAAGIGSDVPCFLAGTPGAPGTVVVTGRGDVVHDDVRQLPPQAWLLAWPGVHQSTADVYAGYEPSGDELPDVEEALRLARARAPRNDLAAAAERTCPELARLAGAIRDAGGEPLVAGSGATVAVRIRSGADRAAYEAVVAQALPGCWTRIAWTVARGDG